MFGEAIQIGSNSGGDGGSNSDDDADGAAAAAAGAAAAAAASAATVGDFCGNLARLRSLLRRMHYPVAAAATAMGGMWCGSSNEQQALTAGAVDSLLVVIHFAFCDFSANVHSFARRRGFVFQFKSDRRFVEEVWKFLRQECGYRPALTVSQFLTPVGFAERKLLLCCDILTIARAIHNHVQAERRLRKPQQQRNKREDTLHRTTGIELPTSSNRRQREQQRQPAACRDKPSSISIDLTELRQLSEAACSSSQKTAAGKSSLYEKSKHKLNDGALDSLASKPAVDQSASQAQSSQAVQLLPNVEQHRIADAMLQLISNGFMTSSLERSIEGTVTGLRRELDQVRQEVQSLSLRVTAMEQQQQQVATPAAGGPWASVPAGLQLLQSPAVSVQQVTATGKGDVSVVPHGLTVEEETLRESVRRITEKIGLLQGTVRPPVSEKFTLELVMEPKGSGISAESTVATSVDPAAVVAAAPNNYRVEGAHASHAYEESRPHALFGLSGGDAYIGVGVTTDRQDSPRFGLVSTRIGDEAGSSEGGSDFRARGMQETPFFGLGCSTDSTVTDGAAPVESAAALWPSFFHAARSSTAPEVVVHETSPGRVNATSALGSLEYMK